MIHTKELILNLQKDIQCLLLDSVLAAIGSGDHTLSLKEDEDAKFSIGMLQMISVQFDGIMLRDGVFFTEHKNEVLKAIEETALIVSSARHVSFSDKPKSPRP